MDLGRPADTRQQIQDCRYKTSDTTLQVQDSRYNTAEPRLQIHDSRYKTAGTIQSRNSAPEVTTNTATAVSQGLQAGLQCAIDRGCM